MDDDRPDFGASGQPQDCAPRAPSDTSLRTLADRAGLALSDLEDWLARRGGQDAVPAADVARSLGRWFEETGYEGPPLQVLCWLASLELRGPGARMPAAARVARDLFAHIREITDTCQLDWGERMPWLWPPCEGVERAPEEDSALGALARACDLPWRLVTAWPGAVAATPRLALAREALEALGRWLAGRDGNFTPGSLGEWYTAMRGGASAVDPAKAFALYLPACAWIRLPAALGHMGGIPAADPAERALRLLCAWTGVPLAAVDDWVARHAGSAGEDARDALAEYAAWAAPWLDRPIFLSLPYWLLAMHWEGREDALPRAALACSFFLWLDRQGLYATRLPRSVVRAGEPVPARGTDAAGQGGLSPLAWLCATVGVPVARAWDWIASGDPPRAPERLYQLERLAIRLREAGRTAVEPADSRLLLEGLSAGALVDGRARIDLVLPFLCDAAGRAMPSEADIEAWLAAAEKADETAVPPAAGEPSAVESAGAADAGPEPAFAALAEEPVSGEAFDEELLEELNELAPLDDMAELSDMENLPPRAETGRLDAAWDASALLDEPVADMDSPVAFSETTPDAVADALAPPPPARSLFHGAGHPEADAAAGRADTQAPRDEDDGCQEPGVDIYGGVDDERYVAETLEAMERQEACAAFSAAEGPQEEFTTYPEPQDAPPRASAPCDAGDATFDWGVPAGFGNERGLRYLCLLYGIGQTSFTRWREALTHDGEGTARTSLLVLLGRLGKWAAKEMPGTVPGEEEVLRWLAGLGPVGMDAELLRRRALHFARWGLERGTGGDARAALAAYAGRKSRSKNRPAPADEGEPTAQESPAAAPADDAIAAGREALFLHFGLTDTDIATWRAELNREGYRVTATLMDTIGRFGLWACAACPGREVAPADVDQWLLSAAARRAAARDRLGERVRLFVAWALEHAHEPRLMNWSEALAAAAVPAAEGGDDPFVERGSLAEAGDTAGPQQSALPVARLGCLTADGAPARGRGAPVSTELHVTLEGNEAAEEDTQNVFLGAASGPGGRSAPDGERSQAPGTAGEPSSATTPAERPTQEPAPPAAPARQITPAPAPPRPMPAPARPTAGRGRGKKRNPGQLLLPGMESLFRK